MQIRKPLDCRRLGSRIQSDERGVAFALTVLVLPLLIGFAALALDFGYTLVKTRQMQVVADAAAYSGATAILAGYDPVNYSRYRDEVYTSAASAGFINGANGVTVTPSYNSSATTINGFNCAPEACVTATITEQRGFTLYGAFQRLNNFTNPSGTLSYGVTATARIVASNQYCMLALANFPTNNDLPAAVDIQGNITIDSPSCGIADDSIASDAFTTVGSSFTLNTPITVVGGWNYNGNPTPLSITYGTKIGDPYLSNTNLQNALNSFPTSNVSTLSGCPSPGIHYGNVDINGSPSATCQLASGTYYFDDFKNFKNLDWGGTDVTIVIGPNGSLPTGPNVNLHTTAPSTGPYAGIAITSLSRQSLSYQGNPSSTDVGTIYWPNGLVTLQGTPTSICLQVIANSISFAGNSSAFNQNCILNQYQIFRKIVQLIK